MFRLKDLPAYILLAAFVCFLVYVYIHSRKHEKQDNKKTTEQKDNKGQ